MTRLFHLLSIRPGEERTASLVIGIMLFTSMGAAFGGTAIEALFFARFGVEYLPYMFIGLGITTMIMSFGVIALLGRVPRQILYIAIPLLIAAGLVIARIALISGQNWLYPALWLGKEVLNILVGLVIWGVAGVACDTRQAKRLFPLFSASRITGQVIGGFATGLLVAAIGTENLLLIWAFTLLGVFFLIRILLSQVQIPAEPRGRQSRRRQKTLIQEMQRGYQYVRGSSLMIWISISTVFFSLLFFSISLPFMRAATAYAVNEDALATFLGLFNGFSTAAAFLASLFLANRLFGRFGVMFCILVLPIIYLAGFASLVIAPVFAVIVAFRFVQMLWLSGIADPAWQAMFNVVPAERRDQVWTFISGVPEQAGTFLAGAILIVGEQALTPQQLYLIGLLAAAVCTYVIVQARRGYNAALIDALRAGRPHLFFSEEQPFGGFHQDVLAVQTAVSGLSDPDPVIRRASAEILGHLSLPESTSALVNGLEDRDPLVRAACLRSLARSGAAPALLDIAASLQDPEPEVRFEAVSAISHLAAYRFGVATYLSPLLQDESVQVSTRAAVALLQTNPAHEQAKRHLRMTAVLGDFDARLLAIEAIGDWGDVEAFEFLVNELRDQALHPAIRRDILVSMKRIDPLRSMPHLIDSLASKERLILESSAELLASIGVPAMEPVIVLLGEEEKAAGALLALERLPLPPAGPILDFAQASVARASEYHALMHGVRSSGKSEALNLLSEALHNKSLEYGIRALRAIGLLGDRAAMNTAIENLQSGDLSQRANVLEALESISAKYRSLLQPLMRLWEDEEPTGAEIDWERLLRDPDDWVRDCAVYVKSVGDKPMDSITTLSLMDRILFLKRVSLFANLSPTDLKQLAAIASEEFFPDEEVIAYKGEQGDAMFVIVSGIVRVCNEVDGKEIELARRTTGDYVGELSIINREPRNATLIACGDVRALSLDQKTFEGLIRERPEASLFIIQVLSKRLKEMIDKDPSR
jgi:HEAT repeat protein